ncbi:phospholipid/cholesterol/gamma-HCH transport system substrate-binding protein [Catalinimonas alkaloidigena]|uniref:MlaD family protein n=1 Tax=Catalinimonas alkaloidigena TaxID=1075417 RepID=UPI0024062AAE|nr:MlaD family protein [Catalinimonas alkaloidigena]MDF9801018.1 phospholipid/cholesterol/gamma-HCH transport system substrate-binding protein [Catalinimonas alkaloidigena]
MKISKEVKVGTLAVIAGAILYFGIRFLKGTEVLSTNDTYYVVYENIDGLTSSNPVLINGLPIGYVDKIDLLQQRGNKLLVTLKLDEKVIVGSTATAVLTTSDLLGGKAIILNTGDISQPLQEGDTLIAEKEVGIAELVQAKTLPIVDQLDSTITKLNFILSAFARDTSSVTNALENVEGITFEAESLISENRRNLGTIVSNLSILSETLTSEEQGIAPLMAKLNNLADSLNQIEIQSTVQKLDQTLGNLQSITQKIQQKEGTMGKLVNDDSLYVNLNQTVADLDSLLVDLKKNPKRYVRFSIFGGKD